MLAPPFARKIVHVPHLALAVILVLAAVLRIIAACNDLWLDELYSLAMAQHLKSPLEVFTVFKSDNNHPLNTLFLMMLGGGRSAVVYRLLSLILGTATVAAAYWAADRSRTVLRLLYAFLVAINYPLIHYSSEARGYAGCVLAAVLAFGIADRWLRRPSPRWVALFAAVFALGLLSHLTFCFIWGALVLWTLIAVLLRLGSPTIKQWCLFHALPLVLCLLFYVGFVYPMEILGGPEIPVQIVIRRYLALTLGWPLANSWTAWLVTGAFAAFIAWQITIHLQNKIARRRTHWLFFPMILLPFFYLVLVRPKVVYPRYLVVTAPFICHMLAAGLAYMLARRPLRIAATLVLAALVAGQACLIIRFYRVGRGDISGAARVIAQNAVAAPAAPRAGTAPASNFITIASNQDFRAAYEFPYLAHFLPGNLHLQTERRAGDAAAAEWFVLHGESTDPPGPDALASRTGAIYHRVAYFPCSELAGQAWSLYHRVAAPPATSQPSIP